MKKILLFLCVFLSNYYCFANERQFVKKNKILSSQNVLFAVKVGGPISCGSMQLWVFQFNDEQRLSCLNEKVEEQVENYNRENKKEKLLVVNSVDSPFYNGQIIEVYNSSYLALEYGEIHLFFLENHREEFYFDECNLFNESFYKPILKRYKGKINRDILEQFIFKNKSRCFYED